MVDCSSLGQTGTPFQHAPPVFGKNWLRMGGGGGGGGSLRGGLYGEKMRPPDHLVLQPVLQSGDWITAGEKGVG